MSDIDWTPVSKAVAEDAKKLYGRNVQVINAIATIKKYCRRNVADGVPCRECHLNSWCHLSRSVGREQYPYLWEIPLKAGEHHD